jgi:AcrR family transcriptional regulator
VAAEKTRSPSRPTGRQAEAALNDVEIIAAAFELLTADPQASMAEIADRAGVGVASLYRRYPTRQALVHELCLKAMAAITDSAETSAARLREPTGDAWAEFLAFLSAALGAGAGAMRALAGTFHADAELARTAARMNRRMQEVLTLAQHRGVVRADVTAADLTQLFEMVRAVRIGDRASSERFRRRYLALVVSALRSDAAGDELPVGPPSWSEISTSWNRGRG